MKKAYGIILAIIFLGLFTGCGLAQFNGSRTGNESQLIMEYKIFNGTDSQVLKLEEGDVVSFQVVSEKGSLGISLGKEGEAPIYEESNLSTSSFQVDIEESGSYTVAVTGNKAKGSVSVLKEENPE